MAKYTMTTLYGKPCYVIPCDEFDAMQSTPAPVAPKVPTFPRQPNKAGGWTIDSGYLYLIHAQSMECADVGLEGIEAVLLAVESLAAAQAQEDK